MPLPKHPAAFVPLFCLTATALAGPDWNEGGLDAGGMPGTRRVVSSAGGHPPLTAVSGQTSAGLVGVDRVDLIEIYIADPALFSFQPEFTSGWDARMCIFRDTGEPLLAVDNKSATSVLPIFDNTSGQMTEVLASQGEEFPPGRYLIAICGNGSQPMKDIGPVFDFVPIGLCYRTTDSAAWTWNSPVDDSFGAWRFKTSGVDAILAESCADAEVVYGSGERPIMNADAAPGDGFGGVCDYSGHAVWYRLYLDCGTTVRVSTCGTVDFNSMIDVFIGSCGGLASVACNDDATGCGTTSTIEFTPDPCGPGEYLIRVSSWSDTSGGQGTILFECLQPNPYDNNGDGVVNGADLAGLLSNWTGP